MRYLIPIALLLAAQSACATQADLDVSLVRILANPMEYESKTIRVFGYLANASEPRLFLTAAHARGHDLMSSIIVVDETKEATLLRSPCQGHYVYVEGRISMRSSATVQLTDVSDVVDSNGNKCWTARDK
jgi:hypothetical protein